jgi:hypothetical protein
MKEESMITGSSFLVTAFVNRPSKPSSKAAKSPTTDQATRPHREIGPIGTAARLLVGLLLVGFIVYGQLATSGHLTPVTWVLGLLGFPALVLAWHVWRIRRNPVPFSDTSPLSFILSLALPLALYLTGWWVPPLWFKSSATLIFVGASLLLAALRGSAGCEFLALFNWLLRRSDQLACAVFTPIDSLER